MDGRIVVKSIRVRNVLSFGDEGASLSFEPFTALIGANGSGKSNLLEIFGLLRSLPTDLAAPIRAGGGIGEWLWKGGPTNAPAEIETRWEYAAGSPALRHRIVLDADSFRPRVIEELVDQGDPGAADYIRHYYYSALAVDYAGPDYFDHKDCVKVAMATSGFRTDASILAQRWDSARCPGLAFLADRLAAIRLYRRWTFGPTAPVRAPQRADLPADYLLEDSTNLGLILNGLLLDRDARAMLIQGLSLLYEGANDVRIKVVGGYVEFYVVEEEDERLIPGVRLSDGTLRYLSLLAVLCHPNPPPVICIEEPELGLHPDLIAGMAKRLTEAAGRSQVVVTTHSTALVSALWESPESVVICERELGGTRLLRLEPDRMKKWLDDYSLGELWMSGELGGTRW